MHSIAETAVIWKWTMTTIMTGRVAVRIKAAGCHRAQKPVPPFSGKKLTVTTRVLAKITNSFIGRKEEAGGILGASKSLDIVDSFALIPAEKAGKYYYIDEAYIVPTFCDNGEEIVEMYQDETGGTIWTVQKVDTIEGSEIIIRARSPIDYEVKLTLSTNDETFANETMSIEDIYTALTDDYPRYGRGIDHVDGPIYYFYTSTTGYIMNVKTGKTFAYDGKYGTPIVYYENGITQVLSSNTLVEYYEFYDEDGNKIFRGDTGILGDGLVYINQNQEGLFNSFGTDTIGFYDIRTGQCVIDLSQYTVTSSPSFVNGYAMINLKNPDDQDFWGILSKDGTWRLEPRKGKGKKFKTLMEFGLVQTEDGIFDFDGNDVSERFGNAQFEESIYNNMMIKNGCLYATVNNGKTYTDKRCRIIKVDGDYNVTYLS